MNEIIDNSKKLLEFSIEMKAFEKRYAAFISSCQRFDMKIK